MGTGYEYKIKIWDKLSAAHKLLVKDFEGKVITRADVIKSFDDYYRGGMNVLRPFLLTMIWGFDDTGYGTYRTNQYLASKENIELIKQSMDAVQKGDIKTAFTKLLKIKGLGISYLSKVLYFASKSAGLKDYTLIFDIRVASSLVQLTVPNEIYEIVTVSPSSKYDNFEKYNKLLHNLAANYNVEADAIELFLFEQKFKFI